MADPFKTTRWTLIAAAARDDAAAHLALTELCQVYWRPVYAYIRRHGHTPEESSDLTQSFFLHLLEHRGFEKADPARGRFRAYLVTAARNFLLNAEARARTLSRGSGAKHESIDALDAERYLALNAADRDSSPEAIFERHWALRVTERALEQLQRDYLDKGHGAMFEQLRPFLTSDAGAVPTPSGVDPSSDAFRAALYRARRRFGEALREEIAATVGDASDVDDELRHLLRVLSK
jgi:RNA polymerase sigma-70 factor (ECF subfamily)